MLLFSIFLMWCLVVFSICLLETCVPLSLNFVFSLLPIFYWIVYFLGVFFLIINILDKNPLSCVANTFFHFMTLPFFLNGVFWRRQNYGHNINKVEFITLGYCFLFSLRNPFLPRILISSSKLSSKSFMVFAFHI